MKNNLLPPKPWVVEHPKAFVLGCDPTAFYTDTSGEKHPLVFKTVLILTGQMTDTFQGYGTTCRN
jgi:hypothetical protein